MINFNHNLNQNTNDNIDIKRQVSTKTKFSALRVWHHSSITYVGNSNFSRSIHVMVVNIILKSSSNESAYAANKIPSRRPGGIITKLGLAVPIYVIAMEQHAVRPFRKFIISPRLDWRRGNRGSELCWPLIKRHDDVMLVGDCYCFANQPHRRVWNNNKNANADQGISWRVSFIGFLRIGGAWFPILRRREGYS